MRLKVELMDLIREHNHLFFVHINFHSNHLMLRLYGIFVLYRAAAKSHSVSGVSAPKLARQPKCMEGYGQGFDIMG